MKQTNSSVIMYINKLLKYFFPHALKTSVDNTKKDSALKIFVTILLIISILSYHLFLDTRLSEQNPFQLFILIIIYSAVTLGWRAAIFTTLVTALLIDFFRLNPLYSLRIDQESDIIHLLVFILQGIVSTFIVNIMQVALITEKKLFGDISIAESYYRNIMENTKDAIIVVNTKGSILDANPAACKMFKLGYKSLIKTHIVDLIANDEDRKLWPSTTTISQTFNLLFERKMVTSDNQPLLVEGTVSSLYSDIYVMILRDITQKVSEEERMYRTSTYLRAIIESTSDPIMIKDCDGRFTLVNGAAQEILGKRSMSEIIDKTTLDLYPASIAVPIMESDSQIMESGVPQTIEETILVDNKIRILLTSKSPLHSSRGNIEGLISIGRDITERKKQEERKDEFISVASHELKTPLTSVKGYIQMLERIINNSENTQAKTYIEKTNIYINRLNHLVNDLLDATKMQSGKLSFYLKEFSFDELIDDAISSAQYLSTQHKIIVQGKVDTIIYGDKYRLEQVVANLISNAIKYSPSADKIVIKVSRTDTDVMVAVTDQGIGISEKDSKFIFEKFYRTDDSASVSGLGIGLYISKEIVQRHGGKIWFESKEGVGTTFYFSVPISRTEVLQNEKLVTNSQS